MPVSRVVNPFTDLVQQDICERWSFCNLSNVIYNSNLHSHLDASIPCLHSNATIKHSHSNRSYLFAFELSYVLAFAFEYNGMHSLTRQI